MTRASPEPPPCAGLWPEIGLAANPIRWRPLAVDAGGRARAPLSSCVSPGYAAAPVRTRRPKTKASTQADFGCPGLDDGYRRAMVLSGRQAESFSSSSLSQRLLARKNPSRPLSPVVPCRSGGNDGFRDRPQSMWPNRPAAQMPAGLHAIRGVKRPLYVCRTILNHAVRRPRIWARAFFSIVARAASRVIPVRAGGDAAARRYRERNAITGFGS